MILAQKKTPEAAEEAASRYLAEGQLRSRQGCYAEAETCARMVIELNDKHAMAHNNLGFARQMQGDVPGARALYERALVFDPNLRVARRNLTILHARAGDWEACVPLIVPEETEAGRTWVQDRVSAAMAERDLTYAGALAKASAALHRGSRWWPRPEQVGGVQAPVKEPERRLTNGSLSHDIAQFEYLIERKLFSRELSVVVEKYRSILTRREAAGEDKPTPLVEDDLVEIGDVYNRILHIRPTPRLPRALSPSWRPNEIEEQYLSQAQGVVVVDDFLTLDALNELRAFCLESTVWLANKYGHGRLGALFQAGFNCPLLLQIAEELRSAFPRMIGDRHSLRQMWGFKNAPFQPGDSTTHADFAAVNINFWITPEDANLDSKTGGLIIYDVDAPPHWDFHTYNGRADVIRPFLHRQNARVMVVPYRQNRAIIFNSDLFHCTDTVHFSPEYDKRRINVTMLYGVRADDDRRLAKPDPLTDPGHQAWRSAAFGRHKRR